MSSAEQPDAPAIDVRILTPGVTDDEAAAATAVVLAAVEETLARPPQPASTDGWVRGARPHRSPFERGAGRWETFGV